MPDTRHRGARILVAEDNEVNRDVAVEILTRMGYECFAAEHGGIAVEAFEGQDFDIVLMDMQMPTMDGLEATQRIRESGSPIPIIALTANAHATDCARCLSAGMDDYLSKPLDPQKLLETIESWLDRANGRVATPVVTSAAEDDAEGGADEPLEFEADPPQDVAEEWFSGEAPINLECLAERCMGNLTFANKMLQKFIDCGAEEMRHLEQAVEAGDPDRVATVAHTLKGLAGNLAADQLLETAARLEETARVGEVGSLNDQLKRVRQEMDRSVSFAAQTLIEESNEAAGAQTTNESIGAAE